jgi:hypothetical protein
MNFYHIPLLCSIIGQTKMNGLGCERVRDGRRQTLIVHRNKQHMALLLAVGGLYPAPNVVNAVLASEEGVQKRILDLGKSTNSNYGR